MKSPRHLNRDKVEGTIKILVSDISRLLGSPSRKQTHRRERSSFCIHRQFLLLSAFGLQFSCQWQAQVELQIQSFVKCWSEVCSFPSVCLKSLREQWVLLAVDSSTMPGLLRVTTAHPVCNSFCIIMFHFSWLFCFFYIIKPKGFNWLQQQLLAKAKEFYTLEEKIFSVPSSCKLSNPAFAMSASVSVPAY